MPVRREDYESRDEWLADLGMESLAEGMAEALATMLKVKDPLEPKELTASYAVLGDLILLSINSDGGYTDVLLDPAGARAVGQWLLDHAPADGAVDKEST